MNTPLMRHLSMFRRALFNAHNRNEIDDKTLNNVLIPLNAALVRLRSLRLGTAICLARQMSGTPRFWRSWESYSLLNSLSTVYPILISYAKNFFFRYCGQRTWIVQIRIYLVKLLPSRRSRVQIAAAAPKQLQTSSLPTSHNRPFHGSCIPSLFALHISTYRPRAITLYTFSYFVSIPSLVLIAVSNNIVLRKSCRFQTKT